MKYAKLVNCRSPRIAFGILIIIKIEKFHCPQKILKIAVKRQINISKQLRPVVEDQRERPIINGRLRTGRP